MAEDLCTCGSPNGCLIHKKANPLSLEASTAAKLGSIIAHVEEALSIQGHPIDRLAVEALLKCDDVQEWLGQMRDLHLLPVPR